MIVPRPTRGLHPTTRLCLWLALMIAAQFLGGVPLALALCIVPLCMRRMVLLRAAKLVWRARWLLLSLLAVFAWGTAGEAIWDGAVAPTLEGLLDAINHIGRLLLMFALIAAFLEAMPVSDLLSAMHRLFSPLRRMGVNPDQGIVRLMLVLRYVETLPRPRDWRVLLDMPPQTTRERLLVDDVPMQWFDVSLLMGGVAVLVVLVHIGLST